MKASGQDELVNELQRLANAIGDSDELADVPKKELLEHLALISGEVALPVEKRKVGPLRTSIAVLKSGVSLTSQLLTLWQGVEEVLRATGLFPH